MEPVFEIREHTKNDVLLKLKKHKKCLIIRPTGYGKTFLLTDLINNYKKVLYLYPAAVIADTVKNRYIANNNISEDDADMIRTAKTFSNVTMMTYQKLIRVNTAALTAADYDCVIMDEAHRIGGNKTASAISKLMTSLPDACYIGATATPNRSDSLDIVSMFFSGIISFPYTLHDAIKDGLLKKPNYCYCTYDIETNLKQAALTAGEDLKNPEVIEVLNKRLIEISEICNIENIIQHMTNKFATDTSYMKFIVFFSSMKHIDEKLNDVEKWFKTAFPSHSITSTCISSRNNVEKQNVEMLNQLTHKPNHIDLICCIDMLNMGYHVNDLTGIVMYRSTSSNIIYVQQLGRVLSAGSENPALVFDIVDNLHRKAVYEINETPSNADLLSMKKKYKQTNKTIWTISKDGSILDKNGQKAPLSIDANGNLVDLQGNKTSMYIDSKTGFVMTTPPPEHILNGNLITDKDINRIDLSEPLCANGHEATYREIIAKAVAEPMSQRCRLALLLHFRKWCESKQIPYEGVSTMIETLKTESGHKFISDFTAFIRNTNINYPLHDIKALLAYGEDTSDDIPLRICAIAKNVSVRAILELIETT